jgi:predicted TIM-barrel fold metal-dependent hydrolase
MCAPLLDLPAGAEPDEYLARRGELAGETVARRLLADLGISTFCVDTGFLPDRLTSPATLGQLAGAAAVEITRLERVAEAVVVGTDASSFAAAVRDEVHRRAADAVGFKSVAAYRCGLDLAPDRPGDADVRAAAERWQRYIATGAAVRCADPVLIRHLIWTAIDAARDRAMPLQFHIGYGDADVDLRWCDPLLLTPLLRATADLGVPIVLLHNYPFQRNAGYLAQVFDHVFVDVSLTLHNVGSRAPAVLAELLELAPFSAVLFASDACGLAELYRVAVTLFRRALGDFLDDGLRHDAWTAADAERIGRLICAENARRLYHLG